MPEGLFMKKIISLTLLFVLILAVFSGCGSSDKNEVYIGEGKMTVIRSLISSNGFLANEVFGATHLPVDTSKTVTQGSQTFAPVFSEKITTYAELEALVKSTYVEAVADRLLNEPKKYVEIDGKLYFDLQYDQTEKAKYDWSSFESEFKKLNDDGTYLFKVKLKKANGFKTSVKISVSDTDGTLRLCEFYN